MGRKRERHTVGVWSQQRTQDGYTHERMKSSLFTTLSVGVNRKDDYKSGNDIILVQVRT